MCGLPTSLQSVPRRLAPLLQFSINIPLYVLYISHVSVGRSGPQRPRNSNRFICLSPRLATPVLVSTNMSHIADVHCVSNVWCRSNNVRVIFTLTFLMIIIIWFYTNIYNCFIFPKSSSRYLKTDPDDGDVPTFVAKDLCTCAFTLRRK